MEKQIVFRHLTTKSYLIFLFPEKASSSADGSSRTLKNERISNAFNGDHGGTLVIADTKPQVLNKACKGEMTVLIHSFISGVRILNNAFQRISSAIEEFRKTNEGGKFVLIVNEADDMFRTSDRHQVFEKAFHELLRMNPSMASKIFSVSFMSSPSALLISVAFSDIDGFCDTGSCNDGSC